MNNNSMNQGNPMNNGPMNNNPMQPLPLIENNQNNNQPTIISHKRL